MRGNRCLTMYYGCVILEVSKMPIYKYTAIASLAWACVAGAASAEEMTGDEISKLISGKTVYFDLTAASTAGVGNGIIYFAQDGTVLYKRPKGETWHGRWSPKGNTMCLDWKELPSNPCSKWDKHGETITILNTANNKVRATVSKVADGNVEKLAP